MAISQPTAGRFFSDNMEILGFGSPGSALVQSVKELFENAHDAMQGSEDGMVIVRLKESNDIGYLDLICTDTGCGMNGNHIAQLCCQVFSTTKTNCLDIQHGKFGVGLKAALLFCQKSHHEKACLHVTSTLNSSEFYYAELLIDSDAPTSKWFVIIYLPPVNQTSAIVQKYKKYTINEQHKAFSGTEIRLLLPRPLDLSSSLEMIQYYFDTLKFSLDSNVLVQFLCEIPNFQHIQVTCDNKMDPIDRIMNAFNCKHGDIVQITKTFPTCSLNCYAMIPSIYNEEISKRFSFTIHLLRYSNHIPLLPRNDIYTCAMFQAVYHANWKSFGYKCIHTNSIYAPFELIPTTKYDPIDSKHLILFFDMESNEKQTKFTSFTKTGIDSIYQMDLSNGFKSLQFILSKHYPLYFQPSDENDRIVTQYLPLISTSVIDILFHSTSKNVKNDMIHDINLKLDTFF